MKKKELWHNHMLYVAFTVITRKRDWTKIPVAPVLRALRARLEYLENHPDECANAFGFSDNFECDEPAELPLPPGTPCLVNCVAPFQRTARGLKPPQFSARLTGNRRTDAKASLLLEVLMDPNQALSVEPLRVAYVPADLVVVPDFELDLEHG